MSTWSGMRNKLENDYLCPALRGHIQYFATSYSKSADWVRAFYVIRLQAEGLMEKE